MGAIGRPASGLQLDPPQRYPEPYSISEVEGLRSDQGSSRVAWTTGLVGYSDRWLLLRADCRVLLALSSMPLLQRPHIHFIALQSGDAFRRSPGGSHRRDRGNASSDGGAADGFFV